MPGRATAMPGDCVKAIAPARATIPPITRGILPMRRRLRSGRGPHYSGDALTDRSIASEEKRRLILDAAVRVFARKGYHASRVGDIAEEAGVAHGLLYHYFNSKEQLLETVFRDTWSELLDAI